MAQRGCAAKVLVVCAAMVLVLLLFGGVSVIALRQGVWVPPSIHLGVGPYELNTGIVPHPDCIMYMSCAPLHPGAPPSDTFVVSLITHEGSGATFGRNLVKLPVAP